MSDVDRHRVYREACVLALWLQISPNQPKQSRTFECMEPGTKTDEEENDDDGYDDDDD